MPETLVTVGSMVVGIALGFGVLCYLAKRSYRITFEHERSREQWEMDNFPDGERSEMVELFEAQGLNKVDATMVIDVMSKPEYSKFFVDLMMMAEIGLPDPRHE